MFTIRYVEELADDIKIQMETDLLKYEAKHGIDLNYKCFAITLKNEHKKIIGILTAYRVFAEIYISAIWIDELYRNKGCGRKLLQALEQLFFKSNLNNINLVCYEYQGPGFYEKCGYTLEFVRKIPENQKLNLYFFVKFFNDIQKNNLKKLINIEYIDHIPDELTKILKLNFKKHEDQYKLVVHYKKFALVLFDSEEKVLGVLNAFHSHSSIYIEDLWIDQRYQRKGYGRLLLKELEIKFIEKGFHNINLVTSEFQAPTFYEKCGFNLEFVRKNKNNTKLNKYVFSKFFI